MHAIVIGHGKVGRELVSQLHRLGYGTTVVTSHNKNLYPSTLPSANIVFICMPSRGSGNEAFNYIKAAHLLKIPVVTCEKAALTWHFKELYEQKNLLGWSSTVGGGSCLLRALQPDLPIRDISGIINATFTHLFSCKQPLAEGIKLALQAGTMETGNLTTGKCLNVELTDILLKLCILFNTAQLGHINPSHLTFDCYDPALVEATAPTGEWRCCISINRDRQPFHPEFIYGYQQGWHIQAGIQKQFQQCVGAGNLLRVNYCSGQSFQVEGPGAGPIPTAAAMILDAQRLLSPATKP